MRQPAGLMPEFGQNPNALPAYPRAMKPLETASLARHLQGKLLSRTSSVGMQLHARNGVSPLTPTLNPLSSLQGLTTSSAVPIEDLLRTTTLDSSLNLGNERSYLRMHLEEDLLHV